VIQDTCTLSSSVNKCITICTPSIYLVVRLANPLTYLVSDAGTVKDSKSRHNLLIRSQECVLLPSLLLFLSIIWLHRILRHSYGISFYLELAHEHSIQHSILRLIQYSIRHSIPRMISRVYPYSTLHYEPSTNCLAMASFLPFSLIRREHPTKTNMSRILLFWHETRRN